MATVNTDISRSRGRPRSAAAKTAILEAASRLIDSGGIGAVTIEAVARMAGVGKPTIYRNWANREDLAMAAMLNRGAPKTRVKESASALDDLRRQLIKVAQAFASPQGRNSALMVASAEADSELSKAFRNQVMLASREEGRLILQRAIQEKTIRRDINIDVVLDMIYGTIFYRLLMGHAATDLALVQNLIGELMTGLQRKT
jgi:AcrR family transcriptional regulator